MKRYKRIDVSFTLLLLHFLLAAVTPSYAHPFQSIYTMEKQNFYCEYCGHKFPNVRQLTSAACLRHPDGSHKGRHKLYEGSEKREYTCKYCGRKFPSILTMVGGTCNYHPKGSHKGSHSPAL